MKKLTLAIVAILMIALTACSNPLSSESNEDQGSNGHAPLYSGHNENG